MSKQIDEKIVYKGRRFTVTQKRYINDNGVEYIRDIVNPGDAAIVLPVTENEEVVFIKQFRESVGKVAFELPAGMIDEGEEPIHAAARELEEETGYRANRWESLGYINTTPGICDEKLYLYFASELEFVGEHPDEGEIIKAQEYKLADVFEMIKNGEINDSKTICALSRAFFKGFLI